MGLTKSIMLWLMLYLFLSVYADTVYKVIESGTCGDNPSGQMIVDKATCQEQAAHMGFADITATTIAMSATVPGGCTFMHSKNQLQTYNSDNTNPCSEEYKCICKFTAERCQLHNEHDCICGDNVCTRQSGLTCHDGTCSYAEECPSTGRVCRCGQVDCTPASGLVCNAGECTHAPPCENTLGLVPNLATCQCGQADCQEPYCIAASSTCRPSCPAGTFVSNQNTCINCSVPGYFCPAGATQSETTFACPAGTFSNVAGIHTAEQCQDCPRGKYSNVPAATENCNICGANTYQDEQGQTKCKGCPNEKVIHDATEPQKHDSVDDCQVNVPTCEATEYLKNNICHACEPGYTCDGNSKITCPPGHYCVGDGPATECPVGRYGEIMGQNNEHDACMHCAPGTFQSVPGQTYCARSCPLGTFGNVSGASTQHEGCHECPIGHMCGTMAMQEAVQCPMGTYQDARGQILCKHCPQGQYSDTLGNSKCTSCGTDEFGTPKQTSGLGSNSESQCAILEKTCPGAQRPNIAQQCEACPPGFFANGLGTRCRLCPAGKKQPAAGQFKCTDCPECQGIGNAVAMSTQNNASDHTNLVQDTDTNQRWNMTNVIIYLALASTVLIIIASHRLCPQYIKEIDFVFAGDHFVEDTHAKRMLNTRLGAAFTLTIPFIIAAISVFVFTDENVTEQSALVPAGTVVFDTHLNNIHIEYKSWYRNGVQNCQDITVFQSMRCEVNILDGLPCTVNITCPVDKGFSGTHNIDMAIPDNHQEISLKVWPDMWMRQRAEIYRTLHSSVGFVGTEQDPTTVSFGMTKCKYIHTVDQIEQDGVQISTRDIKKQESAQGTRYGKHIIRAQFVTSESTFLYKVEEKLSVITQLSTVLTLLISILSSLRTIKIILEKSIDGAYTCCCNDLPDDIKARRDILHEKNKSQVEFANRLSQLEAKSDVEIHIDEASGRRYSYCHRTKKSEWVL